MLKFNYPDGIPWYLVVLTLAVGTAIGLYLSWLNQ